MILRILYIFKNINKFILHIGNLQININLVDL